MSPGSEDFYAQLWPPFAWKERQKAEDIKRGILFLFFQRYALIDFNAVKKICDFKWQAGFGSGKDL